MILDVSSIIKTEGAYIPVEISECLNLLNDDTSSYNFVSPVSFFGKIANIGTMLKLTGEISVDYVTNCTRCLKEIKGSFKGEIKDAYFQKDVDDDSDIYSYEGHLVDISKPLYDNIILNLPMKPICSEDCKGLCPSCGKDLNTGACDCDNSYVDERLEILKNFFNE